MKWKKFVRPTKLKVILFVILSIPLLSFQLKLQGIRHLNTDYPSLVYGLPLPYYSPSQDTPWGMSETEFFVPFLLVDLILIYLLSSIISQLLIIKNNKSKKK